MASKLTDRFTFYIGFKNSSGTYKEEKLLRNVRFPEDIEQAHKLLGIIKQIFNLMTSGHLYDRI